MAALGDKFEVGAKIVFLNLVMQCIIKKGI